MTTNLLLLVWPSGLGVFSYSHCYLVSSAGVVSQSAPRELVDHRLVYIRLRQTHVTTDGLVLCRLRHRQPWVNGAADIAPTVIGSLEAILTILRLNIQAQLTVVTKPLGATHEHLLAQFSSSTHAYIYVDGDLAQLVRICGRGVSMVHTLLFLLLALVETGNCPIRCVTSTVSCLFFVFEIGLCLRSASLGLCVFFCIHSRSRGNLCTFTGIRVPWAALLRRCNKNWTARLRLDPSMTMSSH